MAFNDTLTKIFVEVDDFCKAYKKDIAKNRLTNDNNNRVCPTGTSDGELTL